MKIKCVTVYTEGGRAIRFDDARAEINQSVLRVYDLQTENLVAHFEPSRWHFFVNQEIEQEKTETLEEIHKREIDQAKQDALGASI